MNRKKHMDRKLLEILMGLRYGLLRKWPNLLALFRRIYLIGISVVPNLTVFKRIGSYGPFKIDRFFAFDDFSNWGLGHNKGFNACIETSTGKKCVLDIGAHIGLVSLPMSLGLAPGGKIYSFEPAGPNFRMLVKHIEMNGIGNVVPVPWLVGRTSEAAVPFYEMALPTGMNSLVMVKKEFQYTRKVKKQVTMDDFCNRLGLAPDLIKIDVEGAEIDVLEGGMETIKQNRPHIFLSVHPKHIEMLGRRVGALHSVIEKLGYKCLTMDNEKVANFKLDEYHLIPDNS